MPDFPAYHRQIQAAREVGLSMTRSQAAAFLRILEAYAEDLTAKLTTRSLGPNSVEATLRLVREIIDSLTLDLATSTNTGVRLTADRVADIYARATASLISTHRPGLGLGIAPGVGARAAAAILARPELSAAFKSIRNGSIATVDSLIPAAVLRGATSTQLAMELRVHILGAEALPTRLLRDRRRIGYAAIQQMGYEPTRANLELVRARAARVANRAQLIARTEPMNAELEAHAQSADDSPVVAAIRWRLSSRHPVPDECDALQDVDWYGLGPGVFPTARVPRRPHPRDLCWQQDILRPVAEWSEPKPGPPPLAADPGAAAASLGLTPGRSRSLAAALGNRVA